MGRQVASLTLRIFAAILLLTSGASIAQIGVASDDALRKQFADLISNSEVLGSLSSKRPHCPEVSYIELDSRERGAEVWDARCISGEEYRIHLPDSQEKPVVISCVGIPFADPTGPDCFRRQERRRDAPEHIDLLNISAHDLLQGKWSQDGGPSWDALPLEIRGSISWTHCRDVPFDIVGDSARMAVDRRGYDSQSSGRTVYYNVNVREIAIALKRDPAKCKESIRPLGEILVFPITNIGFVEANNASCTSRVRFYKTRVDFNNSKPGIEVRLTRERCKHDY